MLFQAEIQGKHEERVKERQADGCRLSATQKACDGRTGASGAGKGRGARSEIVSAAAEGGWERDLLAKALVEQAGLTQREAAELMGLRTGAAVSIQLRRLQEAVPQDAPLRRPVRQIESRLENLLFKV